MAHPNLAAIKDGPLDDSLTNLTWLQSLNVMNLAAPTPPITPDPPQDASGGAKAGLPANPNQVLGTCYLPAGSDFYYGPYGPRMAPGIPSLEKIDYKTNPLVKPPYSYATLICMAMAESKKSKITLASIYNWITENFMYYRMADPSWQNSIRHNLSLNKCFEKVPRRKDEPGKGGFWRINPVYADLLENGMFKKRRAGGQPPLGGRRPRGSSSNGKDGSPDDSTSDCSAGKRRRRADHTLQSAQHQLSTSHGRHHHSLDEDANTLSIGDDVTFNALLRQDIEINGVRMKTEDLIDDHDGELASSLLALSPSVSDDDGSSSATDGFDDLLLHGSADLNPSDGVVDPIGPGASGYGLNLMVQGVRIDPPEWWAESLGSSGFRSALHGLQNGIVGSHAGGGLHTPPPASSSPGPRGHHQTPGTMATVAATAVEVHPWSTNRSELDEAIAALDMESIFGMHD